MNNTMRDDIRSIALLLETCTTIETKETIERILITAQECIDKVIGDLHNE